VKSRRKKRVRKNLGVHLLAELEGCKLETLENLARIRDILLEAAKESGATVVDQVFHKFNPVGASGIVVIAESHISIHTWPEYRYAAVDVFTCGKKMKPMVAIRLIAKKLGCPKRGVTVQNIKRGIYRLAMQK